MPSYILQLIETAAAGRVAVAACRRALTVLAALACVAVGAAQETGSLRGSVRNLATGENLYNAQVSIVETGQSTSTDEYGIYRFSGVPAGEVTIRARFVGMEPKSVTATVEAGRATVTDIPLYSQRFGLEEENVFELEAFTVDGNDYDSHAIALNERRNSANLKSVQHAEAFGEIAEGNLGEYLKYLPGVSVNYVAADVRAIKLRGMGSNFTQVTVDGSPVASAGSGNAIRTTELEQISLTNVEMLEVAKLPRPDNPANALGGSVNLVSKNAFTEGAREIYYKVHLNGNSEYLELGKSPGWEPDTEQRKVHPGIELGYSDVLFDERLGVSVNYALSNQFNIQQRMRLREFGNSDDGGLEDLHLLRVDVQDGPKFTQRQNLSVNLDFKATEDSIFSLRTQWNRYDSEFRNRNVDWRVRNVDESVSDNTFTFGEERSTAVGGSFRNKSGATTGVDFSGKHFLDRWRIDYGVARWKATSHYRDLSEGVLETISTDVNGIDMVSFEREDALTAFTDVIAYDDDGNVIPNRGIVLSDTDWDRAHTRTKEAEDVVDTFRVNARRDFQIGENSGYVKFGAMLTRQERWAYEQRFRWSTEGAANDLSLADFQDEVYTGVSPGFGYEPFNWPSARQMRDYFVANPGQFDFDETDSLNRLTSSWLDIEEDVMAYYAMGSYRFLEDKLEITGGVRHEETKVEGTTPIAGRVSIDPQTMLLTGDFTTADTDYGTTHPSVHLRYNATNDLIFRLSYANTIGRQNFSDMFGVTTITDPDPSDTDGTGSGRVVTKNPGLEPRESDNFDFTVEYYFGDASIISASVFRNKMKNFAGSVTRDVTAEDVETLGLPARVLGAGTDPYEILIVDNFGDATIDGLELDWRQGLNWDFVPEFFRNTSVYANGTFLSMDGEFEGTDFEEFSDNFPDFAEKTISYGILFDHGPVNVKLRWNIRGDEVFASSTTGLATLTSFDIDGEEFDAPLFVAERTTLDINVEYRINDYATIFLNGRNATDTPYRQVYFLEDTSGREQTFLESEQRFGSQWTLGVKGEF